MRLDAILHRAAGWPRSRTAAAIGVGLAVAAAAAAAGSDLGAAALRAGAVLLTLGVAAVALGRRGPRAQATGQIAVEARQALSREAGLAVVSSGGRRFLVGHGPTGVALLAELERREGLS
jgi:Flagellar biosynthesis protein, FliO